MNEDYNFVAPHCVVTVQGRHDAEEAQDVLAGIVQYPGDFRLDGIDGIDGMGRSDMEEP